MQPSTPPLQYTTLTYKSAASSARATSALAPRLQPAPYSKRSSTSLTSRQMSLSCIPPSAAHQTDHMCVRCTAPPPSPPRRPDDRHRLPLTYKAVGGRPWPARSFEPRQRSTPQARSESFSSMEKRMSKIVVRRRLVKGTSVVRGATEEEIEEMLGGERYREMVKCVNAAVDIAPGERKKKKGVREDGLLDVRELAMLDEGVAVGVFLKEMRKWRKSGRRKKKGVERSLSADDPEFMRALAHQEEVLSKVRKRVEEERSRSELGGRAIDERWKSIGKVMDERWKSVGKEEVEEDCAQLGRILTAIEPVDPSGGEVSRGTSYHGGGEKRRGWRLRRLKSWRKPEWFA